MISNRFLLIFIFIVGFALAAIFSKSPQETMEKEEEIEIVEDGHVSFIDNPDNIIATYPASLTPTTNLVLIGENGKEAVIDFGGDKVVYKGDLEVDESARIFFQAFGNVLKNCGKVEIK